jgi:hypothetical protein
METLLLIIGIVATVMFLFHPAPQIMYVPVEVVNPQGSRLGCLLPIIVALLALLLLGGGMK